MQYDVCIIGAGPGGYVAAIRAAQLGLKVALVEDQRAGGVCLNWGCIPTKYLLKAASAWRDVQKLSNYGITVQGASFDLEKIIQGSRKVSDQLAGGIYSLLKKHKVHVEHGWGCLQKRQAGLFEIRVTEKKDGKEIEKKLQAKNVILATGARPRSLPLQIPEVFVWTSKQAMIPSQLPENLLIIGAGAIGMEFATFYRSFGVSVTVVEMANRILPAEDHEISGLALKAFDARGMTFHLETTVSAVHSNTETQVTLELKHLPSGQVSLWQGDKVLVAIGVVGNVKNLGLDQTSARIEKDQILTSDFGQTHQEGLFAIGDVAGAPWLAHKASHEAIKCVEYIAGLKPHPLDASSIPGCTYTSPSVASVGLSEAKARAMDLPIKVGRFPFQGNGSALIQGYKEGLIKVIFHEKTGELLGAHMIGEGVTELISTFCVGKSAEATAEVLHETVFPHPTLSEMLHEAVLDADQRVIHF
jgi:dihydrolipoamide dehydrogenase